MRLAILALGLLFISDCGSSVPATFDCTSEKSICVSMRAMEAQLPDDQIPMLEEAVVALVIAHGPLVKREKTDDDHPFGYEMLEALKPYEGKTASELIAAAEA
jgi:hypothetical protein